MDFFNFSELELFAKMKKDPVSTHSHKPSLSITQDLIKIKKIPHTILQTLVRQTCAKFQQKNIKLYGSWSSTKFSVFQTNNLVSLPKFKYWILHHLISIIKLQKN